MKALGNTVTNETVIRSALLLDEGDPYSKVKIDKSISEIKSKRIFASVKETTSEGSIPNSKKIEIVVEEMPTGEISAGAGIGTNGGSFAFNVKENNWLGQGNAVSFDIKIALSKSFGFLRAGLYNPDINGKLCTAHIVTLHKDVIIDTAKTDSQGKMVANYYPRLARQTKRIFRVVPLGHPRCV